MVRELVLELSLGAGIGGGMVLGPSARSWFRVKVLVLVYVFEDVVSIDFQRARVLVLVL